MGKEYSDPVNAAAGVPMKRTLKTEAAAKKDNATRFMLSLFSDCLVSI